jgi:hypothetical protein
MNLSVISARSKITFSSRQVTGSLGEDGVGQTLATVAVGDGITIVPVDVGEQAVKMNSPIDRIVGIVLMGNIAAPFNFNTQK